MSLEQQSKVEISPQYIRPAQISGFKRKIRRCLNPAVLQQVDSNVVAKKNTQSINRKETAFNPFRKVTNSNQTETINSNLKNSQLSFCEDSKTSLPESIYAFDDSANVIPSLSKALSPQTDETTTSLPIDWSLKTKVRFASPKTFPWRGFLKTSEEASGTTGFTRCIYSMQNQEYSIDTSANAKFHQHCLTWMHPNLPWLNLFPRMEQDEIGKISTPSLFLNNTKLQEKLHEEWCSSFRSLYQLLKARQCPYFYLCGPLFTILFRAAGIAGSADSHALITPTSSGLRRSLKAEKIEFTLPLAPEDQKSFSEDSDSEEGLENDLDKEKGEELDSVLESLGLSQDDFPTLKSKKRKADDDMEKKLSSLETLVYIEGDNLHALFNFLLSSRLCVPATGPFAGVPPTLISPCAFSGATMTGLKVKHGYVKHRSKNMHCIELSGAIMPNNIQGLCSLFRSTQDGNFTCMLANYKPSIGFSNAQTSSNSFIPSAFATENLKDCGIDKDFLERSCKPISKQNCGAYSEINLENNLYSCKQNEL